MRHLTQAEASPLGFNLVRVEGGHLLGHLDIVLLLDVADGEDDVNLFEGTTGGLGVCRGEGGRSAPKFYKGEALRNASERG